MLEPFSTPAASTHWVSLSGPDAEDFLHRLTTVHVRTLQPGHGAPGFFLTAQGKIRAAFWLWRLSAETFEFEVEGGRENHWLADLLTVIEQFTFAERFEVKTLENTRNEWWVGETAVAMGTIQEPAPGVRVYPHGNLRFGTPWVTVRAVDGATFPKGPPTLPDAETFLDRLRIAALSPKLDVELTPERNPLELGLHSAVSNNKGCYPGQEVIERIAALGAPARRLCLIQGSGPAPAVTVSLSSVANLGGEKWIGLALLPKLAAVAGAPFLLENGQGSATIGRVADYA